MWRVPREYDESWREASGRVYTVVAVIRLGLAVAAAAVLILVPAPETRETVSTPVERPARASEVSTHEGPEAHRRSLFDQRRARFDAGSGSRGDRHAGGPGSSRP